MLCKFCDKFCKKEESVLLLALPAVLLRLLKLCCNCESASVAGDTLAVEPPVVLTEDELSCEISVCKLALSWLLEDPSA